jgi:hypothetical protein
LRVIDKKILELSGLLLELLVATSSVSAVPLTGTNWQVENISNLDFHGCQFR